MTTDEDRGHELLNGTLRQGVDSHRWAFHSLDGKAKAILTASTITLGIVMGGLGAGAGLAGGVILPAWNFLVGVHLLLAYVVGALVIGGLALIFLAACLAARALRVFPITGSGNPQEFMRGKGLNKVNHDVLRKWVTADSRHVHERNQEAYVKEMHGLHEQIKFMGIQIRRAHNSLLTGLFLSVSWGSIVVIAGIAAQHAVAS